MILIVLLILVVLVAVLWEMSKGSGPRKAVPELPEPQDLTGPPEKLVMPTALDLERFAKLEADHAAAWRWMVRKVAELRIKDLELAVHGARTHGVGHHWKILPCLSIPQILSLERKLGIRLPDELAAYLLFYGAGGAGPGYGIEDLCAGLPRGDLSKPFAYHERSLETGNWQDNEPIEAYSGLVYLGTHGCSLDFHMELVGDRPGRVWTENDVGATSLPGLMALYEKWVIQTELLLKPASTASTPTGGSPP